jgi:hypothetical protein
MSELYTNVWHVEAILKRVDQLAAVIRPVLAETSPSRARYHDLEVDKLKERITDRDQSLRQQLGAIREQPKVDVNSALPLAAWSHGGPQSGSPQYRQEKTPEGQDLLYLAAKGNTICSWRARATLEEGVYRFEGKVRTKDVKTASESIGGAGLRISGSAVPSELTGTQDWQKFGYPFRVPEGGGEVEVVCELRAVRGEAWFDTSTLRIVRLR